MRRVILFLMAVLLVAAQPALADLGPGETFGEEEGVGGVLLEPIRAGQLEIVPILSVGFARNGVVYRAGMSVGYSLSRSHQFGGSFVVGNRLWDRATRQEGMPIQPGNLTSSGNRLAVDEGFGSSLTGFYRFNLPFQIQERTYPFVEVFGGRDYGWSDAKEVGAGVGVRKFVAKKTAFTTQYAFTALFADGQHVTRHVISAGMSVFFR